MRILLCFLIISLIGCNSTKLKKTETLKVKTATFQKYIPGEAGGKGVIFVIELEKPNGGLDINKLFIDGEELKYSLSITENIIKLEASKFYVDPDRDPDNNSDRTEFQQAPLFNNTSHKAIIHYTLSEVSKQQTIEKFEERPMQLYP